ncbi:hypothetical protein K493DRAFT_296802 [Basidiobolus meristosporus CBS 931.73]|uniref:Uncharacterized protein n=1 Tax=Basidiobolus meristosporus CBS 931.73 TaxID=1314790 RepID=A0A1Y1Z3H9_9FUNG|nr:hypothetical protein K493DRAFT_296802 [Basidiobolus meristosporus CBS 931.73]|eukprot:ORY04830.1 hypothetical protein K493DRAFT_296802 [Basidiobolus meristosporus CBS 931.73]
MASTVPRNRGFLKMLTIDPSNIPLLAIMSGVFGTVGYMIGRKNMNAVPDQNIRLASTNPHPWNEDNPKNANYKYKYKKGDHPEAEEVHAPSAVNTTYVNAKLDQEAHEQLPSSVKTSR